MHRPLSFTTYENQEAGMQSTGVVRTHRTLSLSLGTQGSVQSGLDLDVRLRSVKLLEEYLGGKVQDVGHVGLDTSGKQFGTWDTLDWQEPFR